MYAYCRVAGEVARCELDVTATIYTQAAAFRPGSFAASTIHSEKVLQGECRVRYDIADDTTRIETNIHVVLVAAVNVDAAARFIHFVGGDSASCDIYVDMAVSKDGNPAAMRPPPRPTPVFSTGSEINATGTPKGRHPIVGDTARSKMNIGTDKVGFDMNPATENFHPIPCDAT